MKHLNLILTLLILICYPLHPAYAFFDKDIQLLTMRDGLADNTIPCIYKDEDGFMWFGTDNAVMMEKRFRTLSLLRLMSQFPVL